MASIRKKSTWIVPLELQESEKKNDDDTDDGDDGDGGDDGDALGALSPPAAGLLINSRYLGKEVIISDSPLQNNSVAQLPDGLPHDDEEKSINNNDAYVYYVEDPPPSNYAPFLSPQLPETQNIYYTGINNSEDSFSVTAEESRDVLNHDNGPNNPYYSPVAVFLDHTNLEEGLTNTIPETTNNDSFDAWCLDQDNPCGLSQSQSLESDCYPTLHDDNTIRFPIQGSEPMIQSAPMYHAMMSQRDDDEDSTSSFILTKRLAEINRLGLEQLQQTQVTVDIPAQRGRKPVGGDDSRKACCTGNTTKGVHEKVTKRKMKSKNKHIMKRKKDTLETTLIPSPRQRPRPATFVEGDRVLALFHVESGTFYFWGMIIQTPTDANNPYYQVWYEDDDIRVDLKEKDLLSITEASMQQPDLMPLKKRKDWTLPIPLGLDDLLLLEPPCQRCPACLAAPCGTCRGCQWNGNHHHHPMMEQQQQRQKACLFKLCSRIPLARKAQPMPPSFPKIWRFCFTYPNKTTRKSIPCAKKYCLLCSQFSDDVGLTIISASKTWKCLLDACMNLSGFNPSMILRGLHEFYETELGRPFDVSCHNHFLLKKRWYRTWINVQNGPQFAFGTIETCRFSFVNGVRGEFTVKFDDPQQVGCPATKRTVLPSMTMYDEDAWGGYVAALQQEKLIIPHHFPSYVQWIMPLLQRTEHENRNTLSVCYKAHTFEIFIAPSLIPNAGFGLFLKCHSHSMDSNKKDFELEPGELLDLGVFGPQKTEDIKFRLSKDDPRYDPRYDVKNFIFQGNPDSWIFEAHPSEGDDIVFDITNDFTGHVHDQSILIYANETNGTDSPSLTAEFDPAGSVHYMLGRRESSLLIPVGGEPIELKINHGEANELSRVRNGYPRVKGASLRNLQGDLAREVADFVLEFEAYNPTQIVASLKYLTSFMTLEYKNIEDSTFQRLLLLAIMIRQQVKQRHELAHCNTNAQEFVVWLCRRYETEPSHLKGQILAFKELRDKVFEICGGSSCIYNLITDSDLGQHGMIQTI